jgi:hypothetical protein
MVVSPQKAALWTAQGNSPPTLRKNLKAAILPSEGPREAILGACPAGSAFVAGQSQRPTVRGEPCRGAGSAAGSGCFSSRFGPAQATPAISGQVARLESLGKRCRRPNEFEALGLGVPPPLVGGWPNAHLPVLIPAAPLGRLRICAPCLARARSASGI